MPKTKQQPVVAAEPAGEAVPVATEAAAVATQPVAAPETKKRKRGGPEHKEFGRSFDFICAKCQRSLPKPEFSKKQFMRGPTHRKCNECKGAATFTSKADKAALKATKKADEDTEKKEDRPAKKSRTEPTKTSS